MSDFSDFQTIPGGFKLIADGPGGCDFRYHHGQKQLKAWGDVRVILLSGKPGRRKRKPKENRLTDRREAG